MFNSKLTSCQQSLQGRQNNERSDEILLNTDCAVVIEQEYFKIAVIVFTTDIFKPRDLESAKL